MSGIERTKYTVDVIGGKDFPRVRRFDDEARKARVFAPKAAYAVDVPKLEAQLREKNQRIKAERDEQEAYEKLQNLRLSNWKKSEEELRRRRIENRRNLEEVWKQQKEESKEKFKKTVEPPRLADDPVGIIPASRFVQQDLEPIRDAQSKRDVRDVRKHQVEEARNQKQKEIEENIEYERKQAAIRRQLSLKEQEIANRVKSKNIDRAIENLQMAQTKALKNQNDQHLDGIPHDFFSKFGTTSR